jgi:hypothetical protein
MIDAADVPAVQDTELLARYVVYSKHVRTSDSSLKPDAFMPLPYQELSVTRHLMATDDELWAVGERVASASGKALYGRGDVTADVCIGQRLSVKAAPVDGNPNHADVTGWPAEKAAQKIIALELAAKATFIPRPNGTGSLNRPGP